ncbi:MAG: hypothetical protein EOS52_03980 [Mesorhizobium sp.]|uniref:hypothetical protein n=1 Tax=Mesorhizobium sp. TaxID=1871066 RepID=UPI000FE5A9D1|nr:hypothetical protein [Mesorhizobium sp.]RWC17215.1 MAG: hypothetical protein EOS52_03980 [Mesorhizobium sp.]
MAGCPSGAARQRGKKAVANSPEQPIDLASGTSISSKGILVVLAVTCEPVSVPFSLLGAEKQRIFGHFRLAREFEPEILAQFQCFGGEFPTGISGK